MDRKIIFVLSMLVLIFQADKGLAGENKSVSPTPTVTVYHRFKPTTHQNLREELKKRLARKKPTPTFSKDSINVEFKTNIDTKTINQILSRYGYYQMIGAPWVKTNVYNVRISNGMSAKNAVDQLKTNPAVKIAYVEQLGHLYH